MNPQYPPDTESIDIGRICARELANRNWKLAAEPVLVADDRSFEQRVRERVVKHSSEEGRMIDEMMVIKAIKTEYGCLLHQAVSLNGHRVQSVALEETNKEGWKIAISKCSGNREEAELALASALLKLWQHIGNVNPPSYFPYFCKILIREIQQQWRKKNGDGKIMSLDDFHPGGKTENNPDEWDTDFADTGAMGASAYERILGDLSLSSLVEVLQKCLQNPRSTYIVISNFVLELNPSEIAAQLMTTVSAIYMVKHQARRRIKANCSDTLLFELRTRLQLA